MKEDNQQQRTSEGRQSSSLKELTNSQVGRFAEGEDEEPEGKGEGLTMPDGFIFQSGWKMQVYQYWLDLGCQKPDWKGDIKELFYRKHQDDIEVEFHKKRERKKK